MADFGTDIDAVFDLPLRFGLVSGNRNLGNALVRRLTTFRGSLANISPAYGPNYGYDIRQLLSAKAMPSSVSTYQSAIAAECLKDERILSCVVAIAYNSSAQSATVTIQATTANGPFTLVLSVDTLTVAILSVTP